MACGKDIELMLSDNKRAVSVLKPVRLSGIGGDVAEFRRCGLTRILASSAKLCAIICQPKPKYAKNARQT